MGSHLGGLAALAVLALAALVATTWGGPVWDPDSPSSSSPTGEYDAPAEPPREDAPEQTRPAPEPEESERREIGDLPETGFWAWLVLALVVGAVVAVLAAMRLHFVRRRRQLERDREARRGAVPVPSSETEAEVAEIDRRLRAALAEIDAGEPRTAVVATWLYLEHLLSARRFPRGVADTPTEYAERARTAYHLDPAALADLADLYREARFSEHRLTEEHRRRARECLARLQTGLREGAS
jgi:hypothetical protein